MALSALLFGIIEGPDVGWSAPSVVIGLSLGLVLLGLFLYWETHIKYPMLDVRFFANPRFSAASVTITLTYFALFGSTFLLTQYFQFVLGYSPLKAGFMTAPVAVGIMCAAPQASKVVERFGTKRVVVGGLLIVAIGTRDVRIRHDHVVGPLGWIGSDACSAWAWGSHRPPQPNPSWDRCHPARRAWARP